MEHGYDAIKANLFPASHAAICDWDRFPWHRDHNGEIQTHKLGSSQALSIDVFGTIKVHPECDRILGALARAYNLPDIGPWQLELEWVDPDKLLLEPRPTQVDALARGLKTIMVIECKFTETGGGCSQVQKIAKGAHRGMRQCNGNYATQTNPVNKIEARCALTGKEIQYWQTIPNIYGLDATQDHAPCPFRGDGYQWMRNVVLANKLGTTHHVSTAVIAAYADRVGFPTADSARKGQLGQRTALDRDSIKPLSYESIIALAKGLSDRPMEWEALAEWVARKINIVSAGLSNEKRNAQNG